LQVNIDDRFPAQHSVPVIGWRDEAGFQTLTGDTTGFVPAAGGLTGVTTLGEGFACVSGPKG
jgi:hypothetical protein